MNYRTLGRTRLSVSELALGGLFVSNIGTAFDGAREAVTRAIELGINYIDTAPGYADSEDVLGRILPEIDKPIVLSTKLGSRPSPFDPQNADQLRFSVRESLRLLGRERLDLLMIHEPDRPGQYDWFTDQGGIDGPVMQVLDDLKREGTIGHIGLGGTTGYEMARLCASGKFDVVLTAFNYSLLWREAENAIFPEAKKQGMGIVIGSPLQQGVFARKQPEVEAGASWISPPRLAQFRELYELVDDLGIPIAELALRFVLSNPDISCVLTGSRSRNEVELNYAAQQAGPLGADVLARLDEIAAKLPFRPADELVAMRFGSNYRGPGSL